MQLNDPGLLKSKAFVDGKWLDALDGEVFPVANPANGELVADVSLCGSVETRIAIDAAHRAQRPWADTVVKERSRLLRRWFDLMMEHQEDLATILTAEC